jgi:hypothetical protein
MANATHWFSLYSVKHLSQMYKAGKIMEGKKLVEKGKGDFHSFGSRHIMGIAQERVEPKDPVGPSS